MLTVTVLDRVFVYTQNGEEITLPDPERSLSVDQVKDFYGNTYPQLVTATTEGPFIENDKEKYKFTLKLGTKG
jgi:PRTRC genetic system protein C